MSVASYMAELADMTKEITAQGLAELSGLYGEDAREMREAWQGLPVQRRQEVIARMVDLAEASVEMDFHEVFCHAMTDEDPAVRRDAVSGVWESDDRRTIPKLIDRLEHDLDADVRAASAMVLGHFAQLAEAGKLIERDRDRVYSALMGTLRSSSEPMEVRRRALESIAPFQSPEVQEWVRWGYASDDPQLRQSSVFAMGRSSDERWAPAVRQELGSDDPAMRFEAVNAAKELASEEAVSQLGEMVRDEDRQVAMAALQALSAIGGARAKKLLRGFAAMAEDEVVRAAAEESLRALQSEESDLLSFDVDRIDGQS